MTESDMTAAIPAPGILSEGRDEPFPVASLYLIEECVDSSHGGTPELWALQRRYDERGAGLPLTFLSEEAAQEFIREDMESSGCYGGARVVRFDFALRYPAEARCMECGDWGHEEGAAACTYPPVDLDEVTRQVSGPESSP